MEIFLILNIYFILGLVLCEILKKKFFIFKTFSTLDLYLYIILYSTVSVIIFSALNLLDKFHVFLMITILTFFVFNFKKIFTINISNFLKSLFLLNVILILCFDKEFIWWDELSSWGLRTKEILTYNSIFYDNVITNLNKPSGSNLLHYIFLKYVGFNESIIIFSQFLITVLLLKNIFNDFKIKHLSLVNLTIFFLLVYFVSFVFNYGLFSIYTGFITSLFFIKIISTLFLKNEENLKIKIFELFPIVFLIIFFKDFSLFFIVYIILILLVSFLENKKRYLNLINIIIFSISTVIALLLHKFILIKLKIKSSISNYNVNELFEFLFSQNINFEQINNINIFQGSIFRIANQIIEMIFFEVEYFYEIKTNLIFWLIFFSLLNLIIFFLNKNKYREKITLLLSLYFISFLHFFLILTSYNVFFGAPEAAVKASFGRYMGLYFMPYMIFLLYFIFSNCFNTSKLSIVLLIFFLNIAPAKSIEVLIPNKLNKFNTNMKDIIHNKNNIKNLSKFINQKYNSNKYYIFIHNDDGFILNMFKIYFYPSFVNKGCWSFKKNKNLTTFMFNCSYEQDLEIIKKLKGFEIIINYNKNENYNEILINNNFKQIENIHNAFIYKRTKL